MLFDTHAHYDDDQFDGDRETLLASLPEQGVGLVVNPGCTVASSRTAVELARRFPHVYAAVGIHPENCGDFRPEDLDAIRALAREDKVVAIGEIGLDYYWPENPPAPATAGAAQPAGPGPGAVAAGDHPRPGRPRRHHGHRPGISRPAGGVPLLRRVRGNGPGAGGYGVVPVLQRGGHLQKRPEGPGGHPGRTHGPADDRNGRPYLTPVPYRGRRNDSTYVRLVAERIAQLRDMTPAAVEQATWENGKRFFGI